MKHKLRKLGNTKRNKKVIFYFALNKALSMAIIRYELRKIYEIFNLR